MAKNNIARQSLKEKDAVVQVEGATSFNPEMVQPPERKQEHLTLDEITRLASEIGPKDVAREVLEWLCQNVEQFIDNHQTVFRLYLTVDSETKMPVTSKLQRLYMSEPTGDDAAQQKAYDILDALAEQAKDAMQDEEMLGKLYKRMIFYYEMTGYSRDSGPIVQEMDGLVKINEFMFDPMAVTLQVKQGVGEVVDGMAVETGKKRVMKEVFMPEAFGVELEIKFWVKPAAVSMY